MPPSTRVRSALACRIVGLDRQKFNEAVADGFYTCAPMASQGNTRIFTEEAMVPLYFFARLLEFGLPPRRAGALACEAAGRAQSRGYDESDRVILLIAEGNEVFIPSVTMFPKDGESKEYDPRHEEHGRGYSGLGRVIMTVSFYLSHVRKTIAARVESERNILGEEDPE